MLVQDYIAQVTEINNYLTKFPPVTQGRNSIKLLDDKLLDLLDFGTPLKWQRQIQVQNFKPTSRTLCGFQDFCEHLESASEYPEAENKSNKKSGQEKGNEKLCWNNSNNKDKKHYCVLHGHNPTHFTK